MTTATQYKLGAVPPVSCGAKTLRMSAFYTTEMPASNTPLTRIHVMCPFGARVGFTYSQAVSPPTAVAAVGSGPAHDDQYITDLLTPVTTSNATNALRSRWLGYCVELTCTQALSDVKGAFRIMRWMSGSLGLVASGAASEFFSAYESITEQEESLPRGFAELLTTKCFRTPMISPNALNFIASGPTAQWSTLYGDTTPDLSSVDVYGAPFAPIVIMATGASLPSYVITVRGLIEALPYPNTAYWRLARPIKPTPPEVATKWWQHQTALSVSKLAPAEMGFMRNASGYTGAALTHESGVSRRRHRRNAVPFNARAVTRAGTAALAATAAGALIGQAVRSSAAPVPGGRRLRPKRGKSGAPPRRRR